jgi:transcriptional regulator with XRE-family HTH domain
VIDYIRSQIKKRRAEKGLTQSDIAVDMGITAGAYNKIETGPTAITIEKLAEIAAILEVDITYFFQKKSTINKAEDGDKPYGFATKSDIEELTGIINKLKQEIASLKASLPAPPVVKKKKKA